MRLAAAAPDARGERRGFLGRLLGRGTGAQAPAPLLIQSAGHLPPPPLARLLPDALGFGAGDTPFRVSAPIGEAGLVLVEYREGDGEASPIAEALSAELPGQDVFRFRLSGARHPGAETAFHVYVDGRPVRRSASISPEGTAPEAAWRVVDAGIPHAVEADSLPHARARAWEIMTPARQGAILMAMGVEPDTLFDPAPGRVSLDLSDAPGGRSLSAAGKLFRMQGAAPQAAGSHLDEPSPDAAAGDEGFEPDGPEAGRVGAGSRGVREPSPQPAPAAARPAARSSAQGAGRSVEAEARAAGAVSGAAAGAAAGAPAIGPGESPGGETAWEAEVTQILVTAVAHALPEAEQVPWLTALTQKLEAGAVEEALEEARALIAQGDRPRAEREADAARLDALFGLTRK
jgi:hypothetical protein